MVNAVWDYPSMVRRILEIRDISTLCDICEKINGMPVLDNNSTSSLSQFLYHNDRDFEDCCEALLLCKNLCYSSILRKEEEDLCLKSIKCVLCHLYKVQTCIVSLYESKLDKAEGEFLKKLDVISLIKEIDLIVQKEKAKKDIFHNCALF